WRFARQVGVCSGSPMWLHESDPLQERDKSRLEQCTIILNTTVSYELQSVWSLLFDPSLALSSAITKAATPITAFLSCVNVGLAAVVVQFDGVKNRSFAKAQDYIYESKVSSCHSEEHSDEESQTEPLPSPQLMLISLGPSHIVVAFHGGE